MNNELVAVDATPPEAGPAGGADIRCPRPECGRVQYYVHFICASPGHFVIPHRCEDAACARPMGVGFHVSPRAKVRYIRTAPWYGRKPERMLACLREHFPELTEDECLFSVEVGAELTRQFSRAKLVAGHPLRVVRAAPASAGAASPT